MVDVAQLRRALALRGTVQRRGAVPLAMDRGSRTIDADGRMHVAATPITREQVAEYWANEVPGAAALGLDMNRSYRVYRPADELAKAAPTFCNLPLLTQHVHVTADDHRPDLVVGSTGTDAVWTAPYLRVSLAIWAADAIASITDGTQRELSAAYRYTAVCSPGTFNGTPYDLRMTGIKGQHVCLVDKGRAGPDVLVADAQPQWRKIMATDNTDAELVSKLTDYLETALSPEQMEDVRTILAGGNVQTPDVPLTADARLRQASEDSKRLETMFPNMNRFVR